MKKWRSTKLQDNYLMWKETLDKQDNNATINWFGMIAHTIISVLEKQNLEDYPFTANLGYI